jgi:eukaryotic-like serine/threonine-protein kinase
MQSASGVVVEEFSLVREIGRGGMGVVYLANDRKRGDVCAVKLLHPHLTQAEMVRRFQLEAKTASAINHPAIVKMRGPISQLPSGQWYCMMEYVDGLTVRQLVAQMGPLSLAMILDIIAPLCEALDMAHAANIIHRDLKPDNVMVVLRADSYDPKLLDFGIAKLLTEPSVTRPGAVLGTVEYAAPEQAREGPIDRRCDVYALGLMVYEMITGGHLPYDARGTEFYHAQMTQHPIDPRKRCDRVPPEAVGPILAAIHVDPAQRPATVGQFCVMLAKALIGSTPQTDGIAIVQRRAPRLLVGTNHSETLRAPGLSGTRGSPVKPWSYEYHQVLGKGGFGEVLRGTKRGAVGWAAPVAIKRILPEYVTSPEFLEMFHQEARVAGVLSSHPNIVKVTDHVIDPNGAPVIVMELIDGFDLDKVRRSGPLPYSVIAFIIVEVLEGLAFAHALPPQDGQSSPAEIAARGAMLGIVHRDMSHHNVMVSRHGAVKVMDFGIAKLRDKTRADGSTMIKGKPAYLSPEQASSARVIDCRSDLFSVGTMLWELLTHRALFERETLEQTLSALLFEDVPPPQLYNPRAPADLADIAMRLLEREPQHRYQDARQAIAALHACEGFSSRARAELQQLMLARFPQLDGRPSPAQPSASPSDVSSQPTVRATASDAPHAMAVAAPTAHPVLPTPPSYSAATLPTPRRRIVAIVVFGAAVAAATIGVLAVVRGGSATGRATSPHFEPSPSSKSSEAGPSVPASAATATKPVSSLSTVIVMTEPDDAVLRVSDATSLIAAGRSPLTLQVPVGAQIRIQAELPGFAPLMRPLTVGEQARQTLTLALVPVDSATSGKTVRQPPAPTSRPIAKPARPASKPTVPADDQVIE